MAYAADQIELNGITIEHLESLETDCRPGMHGKLRLCGYLAAGDAEGCLHSLSEEDTISVRAGGKLVFSGILTKVKVTCEADTARMEAEADTFSILMDRKKRSRSFQDTAMTYGQLARQLLSEYPGSDILLSIPDRPMGEIAVQYQETDWAFLKRMLSGLYAVVACRPAAESLQLYGGVPDIPGGGWEYQRIGIQKNLGQYRFWQQQGVSVSAQDFFQVEIETGHVPELFEEVEEAGGRLAVQGIACTWKQGMLSCRCRLMKKEGTLSASPDGSGWYYMPETDDNVRVYFPSKYTKDAIAVSAVSSYDGKSTGAGQPDRMADPSAKYLGNPSGQEMKLAKDGIFLTCGRGTASVRIGNGGDITLSARDTVYISAENNLEITAEEAILLQAQEQAVAACLKGGTIQMPPDGNLYIQGTEVKVD